MPAEKRVAAEQLAIAGADDDQLDSAEVAIGAAADRVDTLRATLASLFGIHNPSDDFLRAVGEITGQLTQASGSPHGLSAPLLLGVIAAISVSPKKYSPKTVDSARRVDLQSTPASFRPEGTAKLRLLARIFHTISV